MTKYFCIKEIPENKLVEYNTNYTVVYNSPIIGKQYNIDIPTKLFDIGNNITKDYHHHIFSGDYWICTIPEKDLNLYLVSISEHRDTQINEILKD